MPHNREALTLAATPSAVSMARRWVALACEKMGRSDLVDCAALGTSELVTNAILHGEEPLNIRIRGTVEHPRIEVFDSSQMAPTLSPANSTDHRDSDSSNELIATHGRGLLLVSQAAHAWGATIEDEGKVVWFEPASDFAEVPTPGIIDQDPDHAWEPRQDAVTVSFLEINATILNSVMAHYVNLRRELRLLALSHESLYPVARDFSPFFATFERQLPPGTISDVVVQARTATTPRINIILATAPKSSQIFTKMRELFDLADDFCRDQRLLSLARTQEQRAMEEWILIEFTRQLNGEPARPWDDAFIETLGKPPS